MSQRLTVQRMSLKGLTGHWTKWGGSTKQLTVNQWEKEEIEWYCQSCSTRQPKELSPYMYEFPEHEYIRVCAVCFNSDCPSLKG